MQAVIKATPDGAPRPDKGVFKAGRERKRLRAEDGRNWPLNERARVHSAAKNSRTGKLEFLAGLERKRNSLRLGNAIENLTCQCLFSELWASRLAGSTGMPPASRCSRITRLSSPGSSIPPTPELIGRNPGRGGLSSLVIGHSKCRRERQAQTNDRRGSDETLSARRRSLRQPPP
jgi:hypothetical protein